ncbi:MAG: hypothetical protein H6621_03065 [Halobacteriovoraceae bacterium]|nr:hypothetical protein [Halobacteriovoraceae bacterium]MCB9094026.1 hypothetical protein [Halobacteriovoraceae bacterium]
MKKFISLLVLAGSFSALARTDYQKYVCQEYDYQTGAVLDRTVVLSPVSDDNTDWDEGEVVSYKLEIYEDQSAWEPEVEIEGLVTVEDVMFQFIGEDNEGREVSMMIYLDEMEESWLTIDGNKELQLNCR